MQMGAIPHHHDCGSHQINIMVCAFEHNRLYSASLLLELENSLVKNLKQVNQRKWACVSCLA